MPSHDYAALMEPVARQLLGAPNPKHCKGAELRWGTNGSFMVNIAKGIYQDFEGAGEGSKGGVIDLICAKVPEVLDPKDAHKWLEQQGHIRPETERRPAPSDTRPKPLGKPIATYDYIDETGRQHLQVLRYEPKTFRQRRRPNDSDHPDDIRDGWVWSAAGLRGIPYRLPDLKDAIAHERMIFIVEGEKDVENLRAIGLPATCNVAGAGKWSADYAPHFKGANVVVIADVDPQSKDQKTGELRFHDNGDPVLPGQDHARQVCNSLIGIAAEIRYLELPDVPLKGDVSDWLDAGGTADQLIALAESRGKRWGVADVDMSTVKFRAVNFKSIILREGARYLVQGVLPLRGIMVVWGMKKCGKSFWMMDILLHVALGIKYRNRETEQGKVIYLVLEGEEDYDARVLAWKTAKLENPDIEIPFEVIYARLKLVLEIDRLIADLKKQFPGEKIAAICIDTLNRSYTGSESSDQDMTAYVDAADKLVEAFDCLVPIVHHCGLDGARPRGHTALSAAANGQARVWRQDVTHVNVEVEFLKGDKGGAKFFSEEEYVEVGTDPRGIPIRSLVLQPLDDRNADAPGGFKLSPQEATAFKALVTAIKHRGNIAPNNIDAPPGSLVIEPQDWREEFEKITEIDRTDERLFKQSVKKALERASRTFLQHGLIGRHNPYVWRARRRVKGFDDIAPPISQPETANRPELPDDFLKN